MRGPCRRGLAEGVLILCAMRHKQSDSRERRVRRRNGQVERHLDLVAPIAGHYARHCPEARDDLEQVGLLGLIRAAELYDAASTVPFSAYARRHVRGAILHYLRDTAPLVRTPRRLQERQLQRNRLEASLRVTLGRPPRSDELQEALGLTAQQWQALEQVSGSERLWWAQLLKEDVSVVEPDDPSEGMPCLEALRTLKQHERDVVQAVVLQGQSLRAVARSRGSSAATVHRQLHRGLQELRSRLSPPFAVAGC